MEPFGLGLTFSQYVLVLRRIREGYSQGRDHEQDEWTERVEQGIALLQGPHPLEELLDQVHLIDEVDITIGEWFRRIAPVMIYTQEEEAPRLRDEAPEPDSHDESSSMSDDGASSSSPPMTSPAGMTLHEFQRFQSLTWDWEPCYSPVTVNAPQPSPQPDVEIIGEVFGPPASPDPEVEFLEEIPRRISHH